MPGIAGFADGFSGGLGQGLGIMRSFRDERRQNEAFELSKKQAEQSMGIQRSQEDRAATTFEGQQEDRKWTNANVRPLTLEQLKLGVQKYKQDIETGGVELAMKNLQLEWMPEDHERQVRFGENADARAENADARADRAQTFGEWATKQNISMGWAQDKRAEGSHDFSRAAQMLPVYTSLIEQNLPIPPAMERVMKNSPFGIANMVENAEASAQFPKILGMAAKGDFSFMGNPDMRQSAYSLARPVGMRIAREKGLDPGSARVAGLAMGKGGAVVLKVTAFDKKTQTFKTFEHGVSADHLAGQMELGARMGMALASHPSYANLRDNQAGYLRAFKGDVGAAAKEEWYKLQKAYVEQVGKAPVGDKSSSTQRAQEWLDRYPTPDAYANAFAGAGRAAQNARGRDVNPADANRTFSTVVKYTGIMDPDQAMTRANGALRIMGQVAKVPKGNLPGVAALSKKLGTDWSDPAARVRLYYEAQKDPELKQELFKALRGGQGAENPSGGRVKARPVGNALEIGAALFGRENITGWKRDPGSALGKANPSSWHNRTGAAIDMRPIPGMTFAQAKAMIEKRGFKLIEALNEVGSGRSKHATGDHWHFVLGT